MHHFPYTYILSGIDAFSKYLFATPVKGDADIVARALVSIFLRHSYIPSRIICDLGTAFTSELMSELANLLEVELKHCTLKHAQTIGLLERNHAPLKQILRINENQLRRIGTDTLTLQYSFTTQHLHQLLVARHLTSFTAEHR